MTTQDQSTPGVAAIAAMGAAVFFGASVVATKFVIADIAPVTLAFVRYVIGALCIALLALATRSFSLQRTDLVGTCALGALFFGVFPWLFSASLGYIPASVGAIILATMPLLTLMIAAGLGYEPLTGRKVAGTLLALAGVAVAMASQVSLGDLSWTDLIIGAGLMFGTSLCGALYNVLSRPFLQRNNAIGFTAVSMIAGAVFLMPFAVWATRSGGWPTPDGAGALAILFLGTLGGGIGFFMWIWALQRTTPTRVAVFLAMNPVTAILLAAVLLDEGLAASLGLGLALVLSGIALVNLRGR